MLERKRDSLTSNWHHGAFGYTIFKKLKVMKQGDKSNDEKKERIVRILGLGLDNEDGHVRITKGENFEVYMGSEETHERMQETCIKINEKLGSKGKRLEDLSRKEFIDLVSEIE
jgi:hypothetical protein